MQSLPVLVAYQDDLCGNAALHTAAREARLWRTSLNILHKRTGTEVPDMFGPRRGNTVASRAGMHALVKKSQGEAHGIPRVEVTIVTGNIGDQIVSASQESSLVVMGVTATSAVVAAALSSVTRTVIRGSHCPVMLIPSEVGEWAGAQIVCGVDRSEASVGALGWAAAEAARRGVTLLAVEVVADKSVRRPASDDPDSLPRWVQRHLPSSATTVVCTTEVAHASHRLLEITRDSHGLLVIGAHPRAAWRRASVARAATTQSKVPIVVVPIDLLREGPTALSPILLDHQHRVMKLDGSPDVPARTSR